MTGVGNGVFKRAVAEGLGTFVLVFVGTGAVVADARTGGALGALGVALAFGFAVLTVIYAIGHLSGAHLNPAVTVGFWAVRRFPGSEVPAYAAAQCLGAIGASFTLRWVVGTGQGLGATTTALGPARAFVVEALLTGILMFVIVAVATDRRVAGGFAGLAIGLTVAMNALMGGALTGASMNPARSLGPALASGIWAGHLLYWFAPLMGAVIAARTYEWLRAADLPHTSPAGVQGPLDEALRRVPSDPS